MTVAKRHPRAGRKKRLRRDQPVETQAGVAATVAWTVLVMSLLLCELLGVGGIVYLWQNRDAERVRAFVALAQFFALVLAIASLAVLPIVYRVCRVRPPRTLVAVAVTAASVPIGVAIWQFVN